MKIFHDIEDLNTIVKNDLVVTMGNFDGVHLGHQDLLMQIRDKFPGLELLVITFRPHPIFVINSNHKEHLLQSYQEKLKALTVLGVNYILELNFSEELRLLTAHEYVKNYLLKIHKMQAFGMGHDFALGKDKENSRSVVKNELIKNQINCFECRAFYIENKLVSSSRIRKLIDHGDIEKANALLGHNHTIHGKVIHGKKLGRDLGFPTANIKLDSEIFIPLLGVYKVKVHIGDKSYCGVLNIGKNPTVDTDEIIKVECHILDFDENIYGMEIEVEFLKFIREEMKFTDTRELVTQIKKDVEYCRRN
jgi:riboflavin kinase/FMN adenylyltransferase